MKQQLALSFICLLTLLLSVTSNSISQDYPKLVEDRFISPIMPPFIPSMKINYELAGESRDEYEDYVEKHEELVEEFENKQNTLEGEYGSASGESKINKARELIELVVEYRRLFDSLEVSALGQFMGDYEMSINANQGMVSVDASSEGEGEVFLSEELVFEPVVVARKMHGTVNGQSEFSVKMAQFMDIQGSGSFSDSFTGYYFDDIVSVKHKSFMNQGSATITGGIPRFMIIEGEITIVNDEASGYLLLGMPGMLTVAELSPNQVTASAYFFDDEMNFYLIGSATSPVQNEEMFIYYRLKLVKPELDEPNWQELIDRYFGYFVNAIHSERSQQYSGTSDLSQRASIGLRTLEDLSDATSMAEQLAVSPGVEIGLKLVPKQNNSLYDIWFNFYFSAKDGSIAQQIGGGTNEILHLQRVENAMDGIVKAGMVASEELTELLGLYEKSDFLSTVINDYFVAAHPQKCTLETSNYNSWMSDIRLVAQVYAQSYVVANISSATC